MKSHLTHHPLFENLVPIATALSAVASQENHDMPEDDLMMEASSYIQRLEKLVELLYQQMDEVEQKEKQIMREWCKRQTNPALAVDVLVMWHSLP